MRRVFSMLLALILMLSLVPVLSVDSQAAGAITEAQVVQKLAAAESIWPNGSTYQYTANSGGCRQCFGFCRELFYYVFGAQLPTQDAIHDPAATYWNLSSYPNVKQIGHLGSGYSLSSLKNLLSQAKPGDTLIASNNNTNHHVMIRSVASGGEGIYVYDANWDGRNGIKTNRYWAASNIQSVKPYAVTLYRYVNYVEPTPLNIGEDFYGYLVLVKDWKHLSATDKNVQIAAANDSLDPAQIWRFVRQSNGSYKIMNAYWDGVDGVSWCMDCTEAGTTNGTNVGVWPDNGNANQRWFIYDKGDYKKQLIPGHCSLALDATGDSSAPGTNIELWTQNTSTAQLFNVWPMSADKRVYSKPGKPAPSSYTGNQEATVNKTITLQWTESPKVNEFDKRTYKVVIKDSSGNVVLSKSGITGTSLEHTFDTAGDYTIEITAVNSYYRNYETVGGAALIRVSKETTAVTSISLDKSEATVQKGKSTVLTATVKPSNATNKKVTWSSSDNDVATVDSSGTVRGVKAGTATITAKAGGKSASCKVTVKNGSVSVSSVSLNRSGVTLQKGKSTTLTATVSPGNATNKTVTWKSSNTKVATVSSGGKVTAKAAGTATITATAGNKSASCKVTVKNSSSTIHGVNCASASYADVNKDSGHWTHLPIDYVLRKGYMQGVSEGEFAPNGTVTRAQIVQMLYAKEGKPAVSGARKFRDVAGGKWYANAVAWASTKGVVAGYSDGTFKPEQAVTREQLVTIMYAYARYQGKDLTPSGRLSGFSDAESVSNYAKTPMRWAIGKKIISGMGYGLEPKGRSTRAQIAAILKAYDQNVK